MIMRLLKSVGKFAILFCAATLFSLGIIVAYLWVSWEMNREKLFEMLAIAQGVDLIEVRESAAGESEEVPPETPSYQDWIERRSTMFRDQELREQTLASAISETSHQRQLLVNDQESFRQVQNNFDARLLALKEGAVANGRNTVGRILEAIRSSQAKDQVLEMLENDEIDEVVLLLDGMADSKRARLLGEFKTAEEAQKISEVLRRIRQGGNVSALADETLGQLR